MRRLGENTQSLRLHGLEHDECMLCFHTLNQMLYQNTKLSNETDMKDGKALFYARELDAHLTARCTWEQSQQWGWWRWWCQIAFWSYEEAAYPFLHMSTPVSRWRAVKCISACASLRSCSHRAHGLNLRLGLCLQVKLQVKLDQLIKWQSCKLQVSYSLSKCDCVGTVITLRWIPDRVTVSVPGRAPWALEHRPSKHWLDRRVT